MAEDIVIDNFRLGNLIASGSTSQIYEVFDQETNERYAMKLLLDEAFKVPEHKATLKREYKIASGLDHPNIIRVFTHVQAKQHAYFIMEHFGGTNVKQIIRGDVAVVQARFRKLFECVLMGLGHVHEKGWLHRDLKPDNIMMTKASDVRLIDFSLSSQIPSAFAKLVSGKVKQIQGTRTYIAPEIVRRQLPCVQSDIYSLGVTAFECLTGRPPFMGTTPNDLLIRHIQERPPEPSSINPNVTPEMDKLIQRILAKKPQNRPQSAAELLSEFRTVKIFHEDPEEFAKRKAADYEASQSFVNEGMLDSRADAERQGQRKTEQGSASPPPIKPQAPPASAKPVSKPTAPPQTQRPAAPQQPQPQQPQQPYYPSYQAGPYYGQGMPPQGWPQGQPLPPGYPVPVPQQPVQGQSGPPQAKKPVAPPAKSAAQPAKKNPPPPPEEDLPFADELPDII
ncbi:MAG: serine/threonine-protein kinase [Planctomycetaceae bacterium]|nr:serine/threonine protein kinase [Planctomycetaceae bacterium]